MIKSEDFSRYYIIQIWSYRDYSASSLGSLARKVAKELGIKNGAKIMEIDGPTSLLPDFCNDIFNKHYGYLISVKRTANPHDLKKTCIEMEKDREGKRICDIDVYISKKESIHRNS